MLIASNFMLIAAFTNAILKYNIVSVNSIYWNWANMNEQQTVVFVLSNVNKD